MKVGYIRVSTVEQNLARQYEIMENYGVEKIFSDKLSGKTTSREGFKEMMAFVREGDTLYIESFSRLSRSTKDLLETVQTLKERGATLVSNKEQMDTDTPQGKLMLTIFAALAEFERENTLERQREGIEIAKAAGKYKGRSPVETTDRFFTVANAWANGKIELKDAIAQSGMSSSTFFRRCKQFEIRKAAS